jgi:hypothetical protein
MGYAAMSIEVAFIVGVMTGILVALIVTGER